MTTSTNTRVTYMYRDAANYKVGTGFIVSGRIAFSHIEPYLVHGELFIASQVGLSDPQEDVSLSAAYDHVFVEISEDDFVSTTRSPTIALTAEELIANFRKTEESGWDVAAATRRLDLPVSRSDFDELLTIAKNHGVDVSEFDY